MAINSYVNKNGETRYKIYVNVRSNTNPSLRIQRKLMEITTLANASREEVKLIRECERELQERESQGQCWGHIVDDWDQFLLVDDSGTITPETSRDYIGCIRKHTIGWWKRPASSITKVDVKELLNQMRAHGSAITYRNKMKTVINRVFVFGIDNGLIRGIEKSPTAGISTGRREMKKPEILKLSEIKTLLKEARKVGHPWYPIWAVALLTGMRNGELFSLLWSDIEFDTLSISVTKSYNRKRREVKCTKSGDWRTVPISSELKSVLLEIKKSAGNREHVLPRLNDWEKGFQARALRMFCVSINIPSVKFHALRACFATQLIRNGIPPIKIQKICGWKDLQTMQRYIRLAGIETDGVTEILKVLPDMEMEVDTANENGELAFEEQGDTL